MRLVWVLGLWLSMVSAVAQPVTQPLAYIPVTQDSQLRFIATQNGSQVEGAFTAFTGEILFHPDHLDSSKAEIAIDMGSLSMAYTEAANTLKTNEWFDIEAFPKALVAISQFKHISQQQYSAIAELNLKGITLPVTLTFTLEHFAEDKAIIVGNATVQRLNYQVGWQDTTSVANPVEVHFRLVAEAKH